MVTALALISKCSRRSHFADAGKSLIGRRRTVGGFTWIEDPQCPQVGTLAHKVDLGISVHPGTSDNLAFDPGKLGGNKGNRFPL